MDDPEVIKGYPRWDEDNQFAHIFQDLEKIVINNRHPALPTLYRWKGHSETDKHPMRHKYNIQQPGNTYVYIFDSSTDGYRLAKKLESIHKGIPQGPLSKMKELGMFLSILLCYLSQYYISGLQQMKRGDWLFARDLYAGGDAKDDLVQAFVPQE